MDRLIPRTSLRDGSTPRIRDLSLLYSSLYDFWYHRGAWNASLDQLVTFFNCIALWVFAFILSFMLDWDLVLRCEGEQCSQRPLIHSPDIGSNLTPWHTFLSICFLLACAGSVLWELRCAIETWCIMSELHAELRHHIRLSDRTPLHALYYWARTVFHGRQGHALIPDTDYGYGDARSDFAGSTSEAHEVQHVGRVFQSIDDISWNDFIHTVIRRVLRKDSGISNRHGVDELRVVQTMSVWDNYQVALHANHFFRRGSVLWWASENMVSELVKLQFSQGRLLQPEEAVSATKQKLGVALIVSIVLYPLVTSFFFAKLLIRHVAIAKSNPRYLLDYEWTPEAYWHFRLYNELPHLYESRVREARDHFQRVMDETEPPTVFFRFPHRVSEIAILTLAIVALINASVITAGHAWGRAVVWWLWLVMMVYGTTIATRNHREVSHRSVGSYFEGIRRLYYEDAQWRQQTSVFRSSIARHFMWPRALVLVRELATVVLVPAMLLWLYLKGESELRAMGYFLHEHSVYSEGVGHVCAVAAFDQDLQSALNANGMDSPCQSDVPDSAGASHTGVPVSAGYMDRGETSSSSDTEPSEKSEEEMHEVPAPRTKRPSKMMSRQPTEPDVTVIPIPTEGAPGDARRGKVASPNFAASADLSGFIGAIDADFVPRDVTLKKRLVSLVQFSGVHTHWAEGAAINARTEEVRNVAAFVTVGEEALATRRHDLADAQSVIVAETAPGPSLTNAPTITNFNAAPVSDTAMRLANQDASVRFGPLELNPHEAARWHTARYFSPLTTTTRPTSG
jgi:hypothetical protein